MTRRRTLPCGTRGPLRRRLPLRRLLRSEPALACLTPNEAGHWGGGIEQLVWLVVLVIVIVVALRLLGVAV